MKRQPREACVHLSADEAIRKMEIDELKGWFDSSNNGQWVFHYLSDSSNSLTTELEDVSKQELDNLLKEEQIYKYQNNDVEWNKLFSRFSNRSKKGFLESIQMINLERLINIERLNHGGTQDVRDNKEELPFVLEALKSTRLLLFKTNLDDVLTEARTQSDEKSAAVWAIRIDPLVKYWVEHNNHSEPETTEQVCKKWAENLFTSIGSLCPSIYPPWIIPVPTEKDECLLIPTTNEKFVFNLEQALGYDNDKLIKDFGMCSVYDFKCGIGKNNPDLVVIKITL